MAICQETMWHTFSAPRPPCRRRCLVLYLVLYNFKFANPVSVYVYDCDIRTKVASVVVFYVFRQAVKKATEFYSTTELEYVIV